MQFTITDVCPLDNLSITQVYDLEENVTVFDKTNGIATAIFLGCNENEQPFYKIFINNNKLIYPTFQDLNFVNTKTLSFEHHTEFIKISETDFADGQCSLFVDIRNRVNGAYLAFTHQPRDISLENALQSLEKFEIDYPKFKIHQAIYNQHGIAVIGYGIEQSDYRLFWAHPTTESFKMIECEQFEFNTLGDILAISSDANLIYRSYNIIDKRNYLNHMVAHSLL